MESHGPPAGTIAHHSHQQSHPLSCTNCRQRKVKCNKVHPCVHCTKSGLACVFPERARHPKRKKNGVKSSNEELLLRLSRMEQLIGRMQDNADGTHQVPENQQSVHDNRDAAAASRSTPPLKAPSRQNSASDERKGSTTSTHDGLNRYIGSSFWRTLTGEVEGLKQAVDDESDEEEHSPSASATMEGGRSHTHSTVLFGSAYNTPQNLHPLHPLPTQISLLSGFYLSNVEPMIKVVHVPSYRKLIADTILNLDNIPTDNYVEPLLFAMYYAAVTSLTNEQCLSNFQESRDQLLARYSIGAERALANVDFLTTTDPGVLQALIIYLSSVRANDGSQFAWTLAATAVRLGHAMGLHREGMAIGMSPFVTEMRRRLWWSMIRLDIRCCEDRASEPLISDLSFDTKRPLNINDADLSPDMTELPPPRKEFTDMTKVGVSDTVAYLRSRFGLMPQVNQKGEVMASPTFEKQLSNLEETESLLQENILAFCDPKQPLQWTTSTITRLIMCRIRLVLYHPVSTTSDGSTQRPNIPRRKLLETAVAAIEYAHLLDTEPAAQPYQWFTRTHVQWHSLATTLAELCVQTKGELVARAWRVVDAVFDDWAARIADSRDGGLWRPMKKLMAKAQAKRQEAEIERRDKIQKGLDQARIQTKMQAQQPLPQFESLNFNGNVGSAVPPAPSMTTAQGQSIPLAALSSLNTNTDIDFTLNNSGANTFNTNDTNAFSTSGDGLMSPSSGSEDLGNVNWAEWDAFMRDFEVEPGSTAGAGAAAAGGSSTAGGGGGDNGTGVPADVKMVGTWW